MMPFTPDSFEAQSLNARPNGGYFLPGVWLMKLHLAIASSLALSLMILPSMTFAQAPASSNPATGGTVAPEPAKDAPSAPGSQSVGNAESEANSIATKIEQARKQGKDVTKPETEEKQGEAALQAGYKAEAAQHFRRAEDELGTM
jgi:hypothetical protein